MIEQKKYIEGSKLSLIFLFVLAGIDGFQLLPFLRELGARPFFLFYFTSIVLLIFKNKIFLDIRNLTILMFIILFSLVGFLGYGINFNEFSGKEPFIQFISHLVLFLIGMSPFILKMNFFFQSAESLNGILIKALMINIFFIFVDFIWLYFFQIRIFEDIFTLSLDRFYPTGLFSEPSYLAAYFAIMIPTVLYNSRPLTVIAIIFIVSLFFFLTGIRTFFPIFAVGIFVLIYYRWGISIKLLIFMPILCLIAFFVMIRLNLIDVDANLSSAYRLGNMISYAQYSFQNNILIGYGFGNAHFIYPFLEHPNFMTFSEEFQSAISGSEEMRIPVFNLYIRMFIEIGVLGTLIFISMMLAKLFLNEIPNFLKVFICCSITQSLATDSYIYGMMTVALVFLFSNFYFRKKI